MQPGVHVRDVMLFQARRGDYGPVTSEADVERNVEAAFARLTTPGGTRYERQQDGRLHRVQLQADQRRRHPRSIPRYHRLRHREEALAAAKEDVERTRKVMQTAFDNMDDGVALIDKDMRQQFMSRQRIESRRLPPELVQPGVPCAGSCCSRRGAATTVRSPARRRRAQVKAALARMTTPGGTRYVRPENGRYIEFSFKPISDGGILAVFRDITELRQREEALAAAKEDVERTRS